MSRKEVVEKTLGEIRSFLDEISNGTSRYRSLYSLTEQVEHQYHGRFLLELIQNAHDALFEVDVTDAQQRVEIVLAEDEPPHGALYIANDGQPFMSSNFKALSNLGQSDKDPQKSIGNKGIGFRSVLEITKAPEIYSRKEKGSTSFDGYCFHFHPCVIKTFEAPIRRIVEGDDNVQSPVAFEEPQLLWDRSRYENFRHYCASLEEDWIVKELTFLSPYALPLPVEPEGATSRIIDFEKRGFSTVIRLPLISEDMCEIVREKMKRMNDSTVIFLQRLNMLRLVYGNVEKCYYREQELRKEDKAGGYEVRITSGTHDAKAANKDVLGRYWLWTRKIGGVENQEEREEIKKAVAKLPGKWPDVEETTVAVALRIGEKPENGVLNIYLPTDVSSGCSAHFSAPFYGDMSRTSVDFEKPFNKLLLRAIAEKSAHIILSSLLGKGEEEAAAIIDLLAPLENSEGNQWWDTLADVFSDRGVEIEKENIVLSDNGWNSLDCTRILPEITPGTVISKEAMRVVATYPVFVDALLNREAGLERIFKRVGINSKASPEANAVIVEGIAKKLANSPDVVDWNDFWIDVENLFSGDTQPLIGRRVLLGTDNQLHASDDTSTIFFRPRSSGTDDEVIPEGNIDDIPEMLRRYIAFLNEAIRVHVPGTRGGIKTTEIHKYLSSEQLVEPYGVERIFNSVLVKAKPNLPSEINGRHSHLCADILQWSLRLLNASKGSMDEPIRRLRRLPAPCVGGWYPIEETSFGPGWPEKCGSELDSYLRQVDTTECRAAGKRLLLPPDDPLWGDLGIRSLDLLERAGVFNGIRLVPVSPEDWVSQFTIANWKGVNLPEKCPPGYNSDLWDDYRKFIKDSERPYYSGEFVYEVQELYRLPGFEKLENFSDETRDHFMKLLLISIPSWEKRWKNWKKVTIKKIHREPHGLYPDSPLVFSLGETKWMQGKTDGESSRFLLSDRWYIPSPALLGGLHQFSHLMPMPVSVTSMLSSNPEAVEAMKALGMPCYEPEVKTADPRLLNDLARALEEPSIDISNQSVFLGQVRSAWRQFHPSEEALFPEKVIVQDGAGPLRVIVPSEREALYLPDANVAVHNGLELHSKPVIAMDTEDAERLRALFRNAYGKGIRFASDLTTKPLVDGDQWQEHDNAVQLSEDLPWVIPVVLSVFAFSGGQSRGVETKTFARAVDALRLTRINWVESLEAGLWHGDRSVASTPVSALWMPESNTLLAISNSRTEVNLLSEALASVVKRRDIEIPLKLALGACEGEGEITDDIICSSLDKLHISADRYQQVQQRWLGDLASRILLVRPLILLLHADTDITPLGDVSSEEQFRGFLQSCDLSPLNIDAVWSILRDATGFKTVGREIWKRLGDRAQLPKWNEVLEKTGETAVTNDKAHEQFQEHLNSSQALLRSIIRWMLRQDPKLKEFKELDAELSDIECPLEYAVEYWVVEFKDVLKKVVDVLKSWHVDSSVVAAVEKSTGAEELRNTLKELGLEPDIDPISIHADNWKRFLRVLKDIQGIAIAWCIREDAEEGIWGEEGTDFFNAQLAEEYTKTAYVDIWDEAMCFTVMSKLDLPKAHEGLWVAINSVSNVKDLMEVLCISETELTEARGRLDERRQKRDIQKKTVKVCGADFLNSRDNLENLWDHILEAIEDDDVPTVDLGVLEELKEQESSRKRKKRDNKPANKMKPNRGMSKYPKDKSLDDLIGLAGEIHAFRALQKAYGSETVRPNCWKSGNSRYKYPGNDSNDGFGCDFVIHKDEKVHYVEVKATRAEDETFNLGPSEVELAIASANRTKKKFMILHVLNALEDAPSFRLLPNPYDKKHRAKYHFEQAGFRVRYQVS